MSGWDDFFSGLAELAVDAAIVGGYNDEYWQTISNLKNGNWTKILKLLEVN
jgi:hypothetical protein